MNTSYPKREVERLKCGGKSAQQNSAHCWHMKHSTTDGMGTTGHDALVCCYCGSQGTRAWTWRADPFHGSAAGDLVPGIRVDGPVEL